VELEQQYGVHAQEEAHTTSPHSELLEPFSAHSIVSMQRTQPASNTTSP